MSCFAAGSRGRGTEVLCFHVPGPMSPASANRRIPVAGAASSTGPAEGELRVVGRCHGKLRLGPADARGQRAGRFDRGGQQPFRPQGDAARREARKAARRRSLCRPFRLRPLVAGRLLQAAGLRAADSAHGRQRFRRFAQSGRLQSRLRAPGQQLRLSAVVEEPEGRAGRRHQRSAVACRGSRTSCPATRSTARRAASWNCKSA